MTLVWKGADHRIATGRLESELVLGARGRCRGISMLAGLQLACRGQVQCHSGAGSTKRAVEVLGEALWPRTDRRHSTGPGRNTELETTVTGKSRREHATHATHAERLVALLDIPTYLSLHACNLFPKAFPWI